MRKQTHITIRIDFKALTHVSLVAPLLDAVSWEEDGETVVEENTDDAFERYASAE